MRPLCKLLVRRLYTACMYVDFLTKLTKIATLETNLQPMEIPWQELEPETLQRLLSEIVTRDGTDYGRVEKSTLAKIDAARKALQDDRARLFWDEETGTAALVEKERVREEQAAYERLAKSTGLQSHKKEQ